ncbi:hypothetical protein AVEN_233672-1 [Araneus ventricosus]|uniref:Uncharacterized protein n=1 Tax=Araneus ventricosus TaxID=182803 RepID=A0A4Y2VZK1_ARAVE|nr:hypothetical protein AVEN_233672-1 [Araneus ventricosus]
MHGRRGSGEPLGGIRYCHMKERNTKRIEEVLNNFIGSMCGKITETAQKSDRLRQCRRYTCDIANGALFQTHPAFLGRRRQQQKSWQLGPRLSRRGFRRRDFSNGPTGKIPDRRDRVSVSANVWAHPDQSIALGIKRLKRSSHPS